MLTRRALCTGLCTGLAASLLVPGARAQSADSRIHIIDMANAAFFDRSRMPTDLGSANACSRPNTLFYEVLANSGVDTVLRYYSDENNAGIACKNVTRLERDILHDHGLSLAIVYQFEGRARNRYTGARATQDAAFCLDRARAIAQPEDSAIYFGVDSDAALNSDQGVIDYFREVNRIFGGRYRVGIYAAGARCQLIRDAGLASYFWVPEAPAWAGTRDFMNSGAWTVFQNKTDITKSLMTDGLDQPIAIDTDIVNPASGNTIGAFGRDGSITTYDPARLRAVAGARQWVTEGRLDLFDAPGGSGAGHLCIARTVHVIEADGDWAWVDVDEDGFGEGYCRRAALSPLSQMPAWRSGCRPMDI
ncbi:MAG: hypothetical protein CML68_13240 [Rhodobacteraceae bacterium]|nr:hypothetical protein [Paracoccaceae bacterium]